MALSSDLFKQDDTDPSGEEDYQEVALSIDEQRISMVHAVVSALLSVEGITPEKALKKIRWATYVLEARNKNAVSEG